MLWTNEPRLRQEILFCLFPFSQLRSRSATIPCRFQGLKMFLCICCLNSCDVHIHTRDHCRNPWGVKHQSKTLSYRHAVFSSLYDDDILTIIYVVLDFPADPYFLAARFSVTQILVLWILFQQNTFHRRMALLLWRAKKFNEHLSNDIKSHGLALVCFHSVKIIMLYAVLLSCVRKCS